MKTVIIDGDRIQSVAEFHNFISKELDFPDYYGKNWDAFWDCLSYSVPGPYKLVLKSTDKLRRNFGEKAYATLIEILNRLVQEESDVALEIQD